MTRILHILDRLSGGGPTRSMIALAKRQRALGIAHRHRAIVLERPAYPVARLLAKQAGLELVIGPDPNTLRREIEAADIVKVHYWNNPTFAAFLRERMPAARLLLWSHILGAAPPQILAQPLIDFFDRAAVTTPASLELAVFRQTPDCLHSIADFDRLDGLQPQAHATFNVTYVGTLNHSKLHPAFVRMSAAAKIPSVRFLVCGAQPEPLIAQAEHIDAADRFVFCGFVEVLKPILAVSDVFGYPLCADTYATSEKSLQEAMWVGVPPVVFPYGGVAHLVAHGQTGIVVHGETEYTAALERLYHEPELRRRLGNDARDYAHLHFDGRRTATGFDLIYQQLMEQPKREHFWPTPEDNTPSGWFIESLGAAGTRFTNSKFGGVDREYAADVEIADASPLLANGEGGIVHWRNAYLDDPTLRYWTALVLSGQGRTAEARRELAAAGSWVYERRYVREHLR